MSGAGPVDVVEVVVEATQGEAELMEVTWRDVVVVQVMMDVVEVMDRQMVGGEGGRGWGSWRVEDHVVYGGLDCRGV